jgi:hypothetical protein
MEPKLLNVENSSPTADAHFQQGAQLMLFNPAGEVHKAATA